MKKEATKDVNKVKQAAAKLLAMVEQPAPAANTSNAQATSKAKAASKAKAKANASSKASAVAMDGIYGRQAKRASEANAKAVTADRKVRKQQQRLNEVPVYKRVRERRIARAANGAAAVDEVARSDERKRIGNEAIKEQAKHLEKKKLEDNAIDKDVLEETGDLIKKKNPQRRSHPSRGRNRAETLSKRPKTHDKRVRGRLFKGREIPEPSFRQKTHRKSRDPQNLGGPLEKGAKMEEQSREQAHQARDFQPSFGGANQPL